MFTTKWIAKLQSKKLKNLDLSSQYRLRKDNLKKCYERKFKNIKISVYIPYEEQENDGIMRFDWDM